MLSPSLQVCCVKFLFYFVTKVKRENKPLESEVKDFITDEKIIRAKKMVSRCDFALFSLICFLKWVIFSLKLFVK